MTCVRSDIEAMIQIKYSYNYRWGCYFYSNVVFGFVAMYKI